MNTIVNFLFAAIKAGTPLLFGTTGEILTQKSGNMNLGVEGLMYMGAFGGFLIAYKTDNLLLSLLAAALFGALGSLIYSFLVVTLKANQNVTGLSLTIFGTGFATFFGEMLIEGGSPKLSANMTTILSEKPLPVLGNIPFFGKVLFSHNIIVYLALVIAVIVWAYMRFTRPGMKLKAVGENPAAADAMGINVDLTKYVHTLIGGAICGVGGAYISLINGNGIWNNGCINGQGWISVALVIFASWSSAKAILGSLIFGAFTVFQVRANDFASEFAFLSFLSKIPNAIYVMLPFVITALVLIISSMKEGRSEQPASCGTNYYREER
ncbi:MAG: ABC transporter permease [Anaerofustis stercorihominis]|nr:ABC transporter permease [Anaerofustis stercorihominis]